MATLDEWMAAVSRELNLAPGDGERFRDLLLDMTREVAHGVARPAAPLTAYLVGVAVGAGADTVDAVGVVTDLARTWPGNGSPANGRKAQ